MLRLLGGSLENGWDGIAESWGLKARRCAGSLIMGCGRGLCHPPHQDPSLQRATALAWGVVVTTCTRHSLPHSFSMHARCSSHARQ